MVGGRRDGIGPDRNHACGSDCGAYLLPRQMPADARLGALADFNFHRRAGVQVLYIHAETAGGALYDGAVGIRLHLFVQATFAGVPEDAQFLRRHRQAFLRGERDGAVGHRREDDGESKLVVRRELRLQRDAAIGGNLYLHLLRLAAQVGPQLHRLAQRVNGGIRHLAGVEEQTVKEHREILVRAHAGEQHAAGLRLAVDILAMAQCPVGIRPVIGRVGQHGNARLRAKHLAAVTAHALVLIGHHAVLPAQRAPAALLNTALAAAAGIVIVRPAKFGRYIAR
ncbi:MAG: hypothetical protein BWY76_02921 [bacterium ADurb.Bin429]|nr:MAG: hypothetical protein BWY76_02921 [bacterium ADurb.Bin429]